MKKHKKVFFIIVFFFLIISIFFIRFVTPETQNQFNDTATSKTFGQSGIWSNVVYLKIPKNANVSYAVLNLTSLGGDTLYSQTYQENANSTFVTVFTNGGNTYDGNWSTYGEVATYLTGYLWVNYTKPTGAINATWQRKRWASTSNYSILTSCWDYYADLISMRIKVTNGPSSDTFLLQCYNGDWYTLETANDYTFYEEAVIWNISSVASYPSNVTLDINNDGSLLFNITGQFTTKNTTSDFSAELNTFLSTCTADSSGFCNLPLNISGVNGQLILDAINVTYKEIPRLQILFPLNNTNTTNPSLEINYSLSDSNLQLCWWTNNTGTSNHTITCKTNITSQNWTEGWNTIKFYVNDTSGNENSSSISFRLDTLGPILNIINPTNGQGFSTGTIDLNYTISDSGVGLSACWYKNNTGANITITCGTNTTISQGADGTYIIYMWANDTLNHVTATSATWTISSTAPAVSLIEPSENRWFNSNSNIYFNFTAQDSNGIDTCDLYGNWTGTWHKNLTKMFAGDTSVDVNEGYFVQNISDGLYNWNVKCNDTAAPNQISYATLNRTFGIDTAFPLIQIDYPTNTNYQIVPLLLNYTRSDTNINSCWYSINKGTTNSSPVSNCDNFSITASQNTNNWTVFINDSANNQNSSVISFFVDSIIPSIQIINSFSNGSYLNYNQSILINLTISDANLGICQYSLDSGTNTTFSCTSNLSLSLSEGLHTVKFYVNDSLNNLNDSEQISFVPDVTYPLITITALATTVGSQTFTFNTTIADANLNLSSCKYSIYNLSNSINGLNENISFTCRQTTPATVTAYGTYNLKVYSSDLASNENSTTQSVTTSESGGGLGGGGTTTVEITSNRTYCGDGICQRSGNDNGLKEDFFTCEQDCPPEANIDTIIFGCFDEDPKTPCIWNQQSYQIIGLTAGIFLLLIGISKVKDEHGNDISTVYYVYSSFKKRRRRRK